MKGYIEGYNKGCEVNAGRENLRKWILLWYVKLIFFRL